jgi:fucose permease
LHAVCNHVINRWLLAGLGIIVVTFFSSAPLLVVIVIVGIGLGTVWTSSDVLVSTLATKDQLAASIGAAQFFKEFGDMVGSLLVGLITQLWDVRFGSLAAVHPPC